MYKKYITKVCNTHSQCCVLNAFIISLSSKITKNFFTLKKMGLFFIKEGKNNFTIAKRVSVLGLTPECMLYVLMLIYLPSPT